MPNKYKTHTHYVHKCLSLHCLVSKEKQNNEDIDDIIRLVMPKREKKKIDIMEQDTHKTCKENHRQAKKKRGTIDKINLDCFNQDHFYLF